MDWRRTGFAGPGICAILLVGAITVLATAPALAAGTSATAGPSTAQADCLFSWAEAVYPSAFAPSATPSQSQSFGPYYFRYYSLTNAYLGVSSGDTHVYYLGLLSSDALLDLGAAAGWLDQAGCATTPGGPPTSTGTRPLNDTGIVLFANATSHSLTSEPADYPGQDARYGRDVQAAAGQLVKIGGGSKGFDFTKIANNGSELPAVAALGVGASDWGCTRDNVTGLIWEIKTTSGLRSQSHTYTWYDSNNATNGGSAGYASGSGYASGGSCFASDRCDTEKFVQDVNVAGLCSHNDWRLPSADELMSIVDYGNDTPLAIDSGWFPNTIASVFWSASARAKISSDAWYVVFDYGLVGWGYKGYANRVRLVRAGQ